MKYCELCQAFYISTTEGGLKSITAQGKIAEYFIDIALKRETCGVVMPTNISTFNKWYYGTTGQQPKVWNAFKTEYDEEQYVNKLELELKDENLPAVIRQLGIQVKKKEIDKHRLAVAIARQMMAFAHDKGESKNIIPDSYLVSEIEADFSEYTCKATERYNVMRLIGGDEVALEDYFICNTLGDKETVIVDKSKIKCNFIEDATIESIREMYKNTPRPFDNRKTILIGSGGSGKTLMLQHLFLVGIDKFPNSGVLPIFIELRYFTHSDDIESYIFKTVNAMDPTFTAEICHQMLLDGRCPILMDGLDEIDPSDINDFQMKLKDFTDNKFPRTQVIVASRDCEAKNGLNNGYIKLYVWPFDNIQTEELIDNILKVNREQDAKESIMRYIEEGFIKKNGAFVSHPMLLTFVAMNYPKYKDFYGNHLLFYKKAYEALLTGHDDNKKPYDRVFHSVDNADQFSIVFREFCGRTYSKGILEFDRASFDLYFSELSSYLEFENTHKMTPTNFRHDACTTACMMYERELGVWYIDPGFQEFLFAEYYAQQSSDAVKELGLTLRGQSVGAYNKLDAFDMLYGFTKEKVEVCIFLPFLDSIFVGKSDEEAFAQFLVEGYETVSYTVLNERLVQQFEKQHKVRRQVAVSSINEPGTVILSYLSKLLGIDSNFMFLTADEKAKCEEFSKLALTGEYAHVNGSDEESLYLKRTLQEQFADKDKFEKLHDTSRYLRDENDEIVCFGNEYVIDSLDIEDEPEKFTGVLQTMIQDKCDAYNSFLRIKDYYKQLRREQRRNRLM